MLFLAEGENMKRFNYLISLLCVVLISLSIQAEPRKQHKNMLPMDRDNNGVLSFTEFSSKSEKMFSLLDIQDLKGPGYLVGLRN